MKYTPYPYQAFAEKFVLEHKAAGLFLDMGLGKTAITLSACEKLLRDYFETSKVLVIAPLLPARETWPDELAKWDQLEGLTYSLIIGTAQERIDALHTDADFYIVNRENVVWLVDYYKKKWPFDMVVIDELRTPCVNVTARTFATALCRSGSTASNGTTRPKKSQRACAP